MKTSGEMLEAILLCMMSEIKERNPDLTQEQLIDMAKKIADRAVEMIIKESKKE